MNKKSALATAGGLVASFAAGVAAVSLNVGLGTTAASAPASPAAGTPVKAAKVKPIIRHRTITIHKKAHRSRPAPSSGGSSGSGTVTLAAPASHTFVPPAASSGGSHGAGAGEHDSGEHGDGGGD